MTTCALWFVMWFPWCVPDMGEPPPLAQDLAGNIRVTLDEPEPLVYDRYLEAVVPCEVTMPSWHTGRPYKGYWDETHYQLALLREMCLSWYVMQQPKNHGIWLSRGAPNF